MNLEECDVVIAATDGLFDNLYEKEIVSIVCKSLDQNLEPQVLNVVDSFLFVFMVDQVVSGLVLKESLSSQYHIGFKMKSYRFLHQCVKLCWGLLAENSRIGGCKGTRGGRIKNRENAVCRRS